MVLKPVLAVSCTLLYLFPLFFSIPVVGAADNSFPSSFYVTFKGDLQLEYSNDAAQEKAHIVQFLNGTYYGAKTVLFTFAMEQTNNNQYTVEFPQDTGVVYREADKFLVSIILTISGMVLFCLGLITSLFLHKRQNIAKQIRRENP